MRSVFRSVKPEHMRKSIQLLYVLWLTVAKAAVSAPNVVVLMADDLGIGDVGCYGNKTVPTPNIDRLCRDGAKFTHHLAAAPLCTPSRAAFLTGRYAVRSGLDAGPNGPPVIVYTQSANGLHPDEVTWADLLKDAGYVTAAVGKWHLGWDKDKCGDNRNGPLSHGFDSFFGLPFTLVDGMEVDAKFWTFERSPIMIKVRPF